MKHTWLSCAAATLAVAIAHPSAGQSTAVNGKIAFTVCETTGAGATCDIWVMNPDGSEQVNLTNTPEANETDPAWSPDATKIAYVEGFIAVNRLMVMNADGSEQTAVTPDPSYLFGPTWSPGATQLAFVRMVPGEVISTQFDIIVINVDGSGERNITNTDGDELDPAWSPDGLRIAYAAVRQEQTVNPITGEPETAAQWEIVTSFPDGTDERIISAGDPGHDEGDTPRGRSRTGVVAGWRHDRVHEPVQRSLLRSMADLERRARRQQSHVVVRQSCGERPGTVVLARWPIDRVYQRPRRRVRRGFRRLFHAVPPVRGSARDRLRRPAA